ncbi:MAG: hypothetical protein JWM80_528 [Cyanobacteria bacterium RYN_339]|nr:hypothetical protein [Cyanobacteria bacterium RYN_339]
MGGEKLTRMGECMANNIQKVDPAVGEFLTVAKDSTGAALGGAIGFLANAAGAGLGGAAMAAGAGIMIASGIYLMARDYVGRTVSSREQFKVAVALVITTNKIAEDIANGRQVRNDGFFDPGVERRSRFDEVLESVLLKCQRESQEKKIPFVSNIFREASFEASYSIGEINIFAKIAESLTWEQLCLLSLLERNDPDNKNGLLSTDYREVHLTNDRIYSILRQMFGLYDEELVEQPFENSPNNEALFNSVDISPGRMRLSDHGKRLFRIMDLDSIDPAEYSDLVRLLK